MGNERDTWTNIASALATVTLVRTIIRLLFIDALFGRGLLAVGAVLSHASPQTVALGSLATLATLVGMLSEERLVSQRYPEYAAYAAQTSRLVPYVF